MRIIKQWILATIAAVFVACSQPVPEATVTIQPANEPEIVLDSSASSFETGQSIPVTLEIQSPNTGEVEVELLAPPSISLSQTKFKTDVVANQRKTIALTASLGRAGYMSITANAYSTQWEEGASDMLGLNVASKFTSSTAVSTASLSTKSGKENLESHMKGLPETGNFSLLTELARADAEGRDNVRSDFVMKGVKARRASGEDVEISTTAVSYLWGTGSGKPLPGELDRVPPAGKSSSSSTTPVRINSWCGSHAASVQLNITSPSVAPYYGNTYPLRRYWVRVYDHNGIWPHTLIAQGQLDNNGALYYLQPNCDSDSPWWGDYSGPDIYYTIEARIPNPGSSLYNDAVRVLTTTAAQHGVATTDVASITGTFWEDKAVAHTVTIPSTYSWGTQALWVASVTQLGVDYLRNATGYQPGIAVFWPATFVTANSAYAPVSRVVLGNDVWSTPYPIIHEFGHNARYYVSNQSGYNSCLVSAFVCDPMFADNIFSYTHSVSSASSNQSIALNEAMAQILYEMARESNPSMITATYNNPGYFDYYLRNCLASCAAPTGAISEARVSTFFFRYVTQILARGDPAQYPAAFKKLYESWSGTTTFNQNFYTMWNSYMYRSFPTTAANLSNPCNNNPSDSVRNVFNCLLQQTTLTEQPVNLP